MQNTGEIELYTTEVIILNADDPYTGPVIKKNEPIGNETTSDDSESSQVSGTDLASVSLDLNKYTYRSHNCGELTIDNIGQHVTLCGWLQFQRMKKFFTLRDGYGETQVIIPEEISATINIDSIPFESILKVTGVVLARPAAMRNVDMLTGDIEITLESMEILNQSKTNLPMEVRGFNRAKEPLRLEYRYIDLRFQDMQRNLRLRSSLLMNMREYLIKSAGFIEVETPTLFRRTPGVMHCIYFFLKKTYIFFFII